MFIIKDFNYIVWFMKIWVLVYISKFEDLVIGFLSILLKCKCNDFLFNKLIVYILYINGLCIKIYGFDNLILFFSLIILCLIEEFCRIFKGWNLELEGFELIYIYLN